MYKTNIFININYLQIKQEVLPAAIHDLLPSSNRFYPLCISPLKINCRQLENATITRHLTVISVAEGAGIPPA
jgi:hypothetical protein